MLFQLLLVIRGSMHRLSMMTGIVVLTSCLAWSDMARGADGTEFFEKQVRPLLVARCYACHSGTKAGGGLSLESAAAWQRGGESGPAIVAGKPNDSLLIDAINYRSLEMPPREAGGQISADEIAVLTRWVQIGAPDPRDTADKLGGMTREQAATWWAFQPLPKVDIPDAANSSSTATMVDQLLQAKLDQHRHDVAPPADKRSLIRRATYDLTGLPPTPYEVDAFLADDSPDAFRRVIDRLLDSPQYGAHWGRHWLDVVRYADTAGENTDRPLPHAWRYRNWVIESLNQDLPFDEFARLQIAGDILTADAATHEQAAGIIATGYLAIARRFGHDIDKDIHLMHEDVIDNLGKNFLGLTLGCARCHDHKYDPVSTADYYALYGIFDSSRFSFPGCEPKGQPRDLVPIIAAAEADSLTSDYQRRLAEYEQREQRAAETTQRLRQLAIDATHTLAKSPVGEGQTVSLEAAADGALDRIALRKGETLQLTVQPNANHGADTTRVVLEIASLDNTDRRWNVAELIPRFTEKGPAISIRDATWCLLDVANGPTFLHEKKLNIEGQPSLSAWAIGDTPSSVVNSAKQPISVWTTLPPESFFIHPGHQRDVAVAWICPADGDYQVRGVVTDAHPAGLDGVAFHLDHIASADYGTGLLQLGETITSDDGQRPQPPAIPVAYAVVEAAPHDARLHERGDPEQLGDEVPRRWLSAFGGQTVSPDAGSGRRELAHWVTAHPLFARVTVNRIWQWHFGRGLVATANDFGSRGEPPTHPELLDWLAAQLQANGYRLKPLHRLIMLSSAYQRSSLAAPETIAADPDNRWLARFSRRRLTAEELRDTLLVASGNLDLSPGQAHPFPPESDWKYTQHNPFTAIYDTNRRSVFLMVQRQRRHPYLALFDGADPNSSTAARQTTTVPTQALFFLNAPFFHEQSAEFAQRVEKEAELEAQIRLAFQFLFQRVPNTSEMAAAQQFHTQYPGTSHDRWSAYARVLMASNEFIYVD